MRCQKPNAVSVALVSAACTALVAGCAQNGAAEPFPPTPAQQGRAIAQAECASCHAVRELGASPRASAPPLREVLDSYSANRLEQAFREGLLVGHIDMPVFEYSDAEIDALLAYLQDIRT